MGWDRPPLGDGAMLPPSVHVDGAMFPRPTLIGKSYHLVLNDALGGTFQNVSAYTHWIKLNMACPASGSAHVASNGRDMTQGTAAPPSWFRCNSALPPLGHLPSTAAPYRPPATCLSLPF